MSKLIVCATTGTILNVEQCFLVDTDDLNESDSALLDNASDSEIGELAKRAGKSLLVTYGSDTGWGDNAYRFTVSYSPNSIRDEADAILDGGVYDDPEDSHIKEAMEWALTAKTEELKVVGDYAMSDDHVWDGFRRNLVDALVFVYEEMTKEKK